jgi:hypothetical protein
MKRDAFALKLANLIRHGRACVYMDEAAFSNQLMIKKAWSLPGERV